MHHALATYFSCKLLLHLAPKPKHALPYTLPGTSANDTLNKVKETVIELDPTAVHYSISTLSQVTSSLTANGTQQIMSLRKENKA